MHFVRALATIQPKIFVFENVPGLLSANRGLAYHRIFADLRDLRRCWLEIRQKLGEDASVPPPPDYEVVFARVVNAADVGVPQSRKRLILIGVRRDILRGHFLEATWICDRHLLGLDMLFRKYPLTPLEVFEGRPLPELRRRYAEIMQAYADLLPNGWGVWSRTTSASWGPSRRAPPSWSAPSSNMSRSFGIWAMREGRSTRCGPQTIARNRPRNPRRCCAACG
jgi:site-specific DNA-cytosine methylase